MAGKDIVQVRLTEAGKKLADGHPLTVNNGRRSITFNPGEQTGVERNSEWKAILEPYHTHDGATLFELAPDASAQAAE